MDIPHVTATSWGYLRTEIWYTGGGEGGVRYAYQIVIVLREIPIEFFVKIYACVELCAGVMCVRHVDVREVNVAVVSNIP